MTIWLAYLAIPAALIYFVARRRRDVPFPWMFWMFGAFIVACGFTHFMEVLTTFTPVYRLSGVVKLLTGLISWATVLALIPVIPRAIALRSPEDLEKEIAERILAEEQLRARESQQAAVAQLGQWALAHTSLYELMDRIAALLAQTLTVEFAQVLELLPDGAEFLQRAGAGWREGSVGKARVGAGTHSQAGYTLLRQEPVIVEEHGKETRFEGAPLLVAHGVVSGMTVPIDGRDQPFGVLGAYSSRSRRFTQDDVHFLQAVANILTLALKRRQVEEVQAQLAAIVEYSDDAIISMTREGKITSWNAGAEKLFGYAAHEAQGRPLSLIVPSGSSQSLSHMFQRIKEGNRIDHFETQRLHKDGKKIEVSLTISPVKNAAGTITGFAKIARDITERKQAEQALKQAFDQLDLRVQERTAELTRANQALQAEIAERLRTEEALKVSEAKYQDLYDNAPDLFASVEAAGGTILHCNQTFASALGYAKAELLGRPIFDVYHPDCLEEARQTLRTFRTAGRILDAELQLRRQDGRTFDVSLNASAVRDDRDNILYSRSVWRDVTERKRAEEQLKAALREKEVLIKEIQHRVKNNLQLVASLLNLQSGYIKDKAALEIFRESQLRIRCMALIQEKFYRAGNLTRINFSEYVRNLASSLAQAYGISDKDIVLKTQIDDVFLGIDTAIPCGLVINELVSNSLKHAFPADTAGEIHIHLRAREDCRIALTVSDNGVGLPSGLDVRHTDSLGLQLVNTLIDQLGGTLEIENGRGTTFRIIFEELRYKSRV